MKKIDLPVHVVDASRMPKVMLVKLIYGNDWKYININIPEKFSTSYGGDYHAPSHVMDSRLKKPVNLIDKGIAKGIIWKTTV